MKFEDQVRLVVTTIWENSPPEKREGETLESAMADVLEAIADPENAQEVEIARKALGALWGAGFTAGADSVMKG